MRVSVDGGKYTYVITETNAHVLRYGELWKDATGDKFTYSMAAEIESLREQVEELTKERDTEIARNRPLQSLIKSMEETKLILLKKSEENKEAVKQLDSERQVNALLTEELAALAEQNEKMREALRLARFDSLNMTLAGWEKLKEAAVLPDLATPMLNRIKAEAYREAALYCDSRNSKREYPYTCYAQGYDDAASDCADAIRSKADELENSK